MKWLIYLALILNIIPTFYGLYSLFVLVYGTVKKKKTIPYHDPVKRLAVVTAARNEESCIGHLVESLKQQKYPKELYDIYVVVNNCTDNTAEVAEKAGAKVLNVDTEVHTKGDVLRWYFSKTVPSTSYDGYVIFDADNVVDPMFLQVANNTLCAGYQAGQGYRNSKNADEGRIAGCMSIFYWFMSHFFNNARCSLNISAHTNGTGILIGEKLLEKNGYVGCTLTEDHEFNAQCALSDERIIFMRDAVTYDEQPTDSHTSFVQRHRWAAGFKQCIKLYLIPISQKFFHNVTCCDMTIHFSSMICVILSLIGGVLIIIERVFAVIKNPHTALHPTILYFLSMVLLFFIANSLWAFLVCLIEKKLSEKMIIPILTMGFFMIDWTIINILGFISKPPKWTYIPHNSRYNTEKQ